MRRIVAFLIGIGATMGLFAAGAAFGAPSETLRYALETGLSGADHWGGRPRHPAVVNAVCERTRPELISLRGKWDFLTKRSFSGNRMCGFRSPKFWDEAKPIDVPSCWEAQGIGEEGEGGCHAHPDASPKPIRHHFVGEGWYRKIVEIPAAWAGRRIWLKVGGVRSKGWFFVNKRAVALVDVFAGAWKYDITDCVKPGEKAMVVACADNLPAARNGQPSSVTRWGGLVRDVEIEATPAECFMDDVWVRGDFDRQEAEVHVELDGVEFASSKFKVQSSKLRVTVEGETKEIALRSTPTPSTYTLEIPLRNFRPWSPECPNLYTARVDLVSADGTVLQTRDERFGVRKLEVRGTRFYLNGRPFFFRGFGDDSVYPLTGFSPASREFHLAHLRKARAAGFNYVRLHTHCEVPEYFEAADEAGIIVQGELSYYRDECDDLFDYAPFRDAEERWIAFRRHPSWCIASGGNEGTLGGDAGTGRRLYAFLKRIDPDRLVIEEDGPLTDVTDETQGLGASDFLGGPLNTWQRGTYAPGRPFVCHEYLNLSVKQDSRLEDAFTGAWLPPETRARRAERLAAAGLTHDWGDRLQDAQHALQALFQKMGIECARRDPFCGGYCYWTIADVTVLNKKLGFYTAQGLFDAFWNPKSGGNSPSGFAVFNGPSCVLLDLAKPPPFTKDVRRVDGRWWMSGNWTDTNRVFTAGEAIPAEFLLAHYGADDLRAVRLDWRLADADGRVLATGGRNVGTWKAGPVGTVAEERIAVPALPRACRARLTAAVTADGAGTVCANAWDFWLFPKRAVRTMPGLACAAEFGPKLSKRYAGLADLSAAGVRVAIVREGSADEDRAKRSGANVITLDRQDGKPNFKLGWWWIGDQVGTAAVRHPALDGFPYEPCLSPLLFRIIKTGTPLTAAFKDAEGLIVAGEGGSDFFRYLSEERLPGGARVVRISGLDVLSDLPEGAALLDSVVDYLCRTK